MKPRAQEALEKAIRTNNQIYVIEHIRKHPDTPKLDKLFSNGDSALDVACFLGRVEIAALLINAGANVDGNKEANPTLEAVMYSTACLFTPLISAAGRIDVNLVRLLLEKNADVKKTVLGENALHLVARTGGRFKQINSVGSWLKFISGTGSMYNYEEHKQVIKLLLDHGIDINLPSLYDGSSALHLAAAADHLEVVDFLLNNNAAINQQKYDGSTPLLAAVQAGHYEVAELLLKKAADVNAINNNGENALHLAVKNDSRDIVELLLKHGADVNSRMKNGDTALHLVAQKGWVKTAKILLSHGADIQLTRPSHAGNHVTPLQIAKKYGNNEVVTLLQNHNKNHFAFLKFFNANRSDHTNSPATPLLTGKSQTNTEQDDHDDIKRSTFSGVRKIK